MTITLRDKPRRAPGESMDAWRVRRQEMASALLAGVVRRPSAAAPAASAAPVRQVSVRGRTYDVTAADGPALMGALAMAVDGETASITLASGDVLTLTHQEVSDLGRQLAGKPADEVSG